MTNATPPAPSPAASLPPWQSWWIALLFLVTLLAYIPVYHAGYVWDDMELAVKNPHVVQPDGIIRAFTAFDGPDYWPLTAASFWLEYRLWGDTSIGFHAVQVLLHATNAALVLLILRKLKVPGALLIALLFAVHPMAVESVAWVAEQKNTLSFLLAALSVLAYLQSEQEQGVTPRDDRRNARWYAASLLFFLLSLLSKTSTVVLPVILLLLIWFRQKRLTRADIARSVPFFVVSLIMGLITVRFQTSVLPTDVVNRPWPLRLAQAGCSIWFYPFKAWIPVDLVTFYPEWQVKAVGPMQWLPLLLAISAAAIVFSLRRRFPGVAVALAIAAAVVLPTLGLINMAWTNFSPVADHFAYLALPGLIALPVSGATTLARNLSAQYRRLLPLAGAAAVVILASLSFTQSRIYGSSHTLWQFNAARRPQSWYANAQLGCTLYSEGKNEEAIALLRRSVELRPIESRTWNSLGKALQLKRDFQGAADAYANALKYFPVDRGAKSGLGYCLYKLGDAPRAIAMMEEAVHQDSGDADGFIRLGAALADEGNNARAVVVYQHYLMLQPNDARGHFNLANALLLTNQAAAALPEYKISLQLDPNSARTWLNMGVALLTLNRGGEARDALVKAGQLDAALVPQVQLILRSAPQPR